MIEILRTKYSAPHHLPLLLIGDEHQPMLERYVHRATLYTAMLDGEPVGIGAVTRETDGTVEIQNLAVLPSHRRQGIGNALMSHIEHSQPTGTTIYLGTGETPSTLRFYRNRGYTYSHTVPDHFTEHYPGPIVEEGVTLRHQIYLRKTITK